MMDPRQIRCFIEVADCLHFGRAAEQLGIAQSALSRHIQMLESTLGVRLFARNKRSPIHLTEAGASFLAEARTAIAQLEKAEMTARQAARGECGRIEIGYVASATYSGLLPSIVSDYHRDYPEVSISLTEMETSRQLEALTENRIDVGFLRPRPEYPAGIVVRSLLREPVLIALRADHPLARGGRKIQPIRLADEAFIVPQSDDRVGFSEYTIDVGHRGGFVPHFAYHVRDFITVLNLVAIGLGVSVVPASLQSVRLPGVVYRQLAAVSLFTEIVAATRRGNNGPVARLFIDHLRRCGQIDWPTAPPLSRTDG